MFVEFSAGYYLGSCYVAGHADEQAAMNRQEYLRTCNTYYGGMGPLVMKLDGVHFPVVGDEAVPAGEIHLPPHLLRRTDSQNGPEQREVFLTKQSAFSSVPV